jgi:hypothetical protein
MRRCGDFKVFISPSRVEITKNPVMEWNANDMGIMIRNGWEV